MEKTFSIHTIGCKLNQFESEWIRQALLRREWKFHRFEEGAQFYVINSCTVTAKSDARCRNAVRRARRRTPGAFIIVTGCYAQTQPEQLAKMQEVDLVVGNDGKRSLPALMEEIAAGATTVSPPPETVLPNEYAGTGEAIDCFLDHSRAFVKIQDGCDASCSYCIIPRARGPSRSTASEAVIDQVMRLRENGYREIVLTGIHLGRYGFDLSPRRTLARLIDELIRLTAADLRFRLSSIEINEVTPALLELMAPGGRLAPHLHIPLQSGHDGILAAMKRPYDARTFRSRVEEIVRSNQEVGIGTDVIVGFPGETAESHECTAALVRDLPFNYLHVFSFSPRPGTAAARMPGQVGPDQKKRWSAALIDLGRRKRRAFMRAQIGTVHEALVQEPAHRTSPFMRALTGNYCEVFVRSSEAYRGALASVRISHSLRGALYGSIVNAAGAPADAADETGQ
jgi:threonylcarbamoyladenosine tRNA methylthiotransferase MtaB